MTSQIIKLLACPNCHSELLENQENLLCQNCGANYEIKDKIPILAKLNNLPKHLAQQIKYFENENITAGDYSLAEWQKSYLERFKSNFPDYKNKIIIDCGAGSGYMAVELAKLGAMVIACDLTLKNLLTLKDKIKNFNLQDNIFLVCCSAEALPLKGQIADYFIANAILEHLPEEKKAIAEINRICKKGGGLMLTVPLNYKYINPLFLPLNYWHDKKIGHLRRYNAKTLFEKFIGWETGAVYYTGHFAKVFKTAVNFVTPIFNGQIIELDDQKMEDKKLWASNLSAFLKKI